MEVRVLRETEAAEWWRIRMEALEVEPFAFSKALAEHRETPVAEMAQRFRATDDNYFNLGAFVNGALAGTATFVREKGEKERHKGRIYAVYVSASHRGEGIGRVLLTTLLEMAKRDTSLEQILLFVAASQTAAIALYRSLGFETFGTEPRALKVGAEYVDEDYMILRIRT